MSINQTVFDFCEEQGKNFKFGEHILVVINKIIVHYNEEALKWKEIYKNNVVTPEFEGKTMMSLIKKTEFDKIENVESLDLSTFHEYALKKGYNPFQDLATKLTKLSQNLQAKLSNYDEFTEYFSSYEHYCCVEFVIGIVGQEHLNLFIPPITLSG